MVKYLKNTPKSWSLPEMVFSYVLVNQIYEKIKANPQICSVSRFPWCKYSHHGQFQVTSVASLNMELGRDMQNCLSGAGKSRHQHITKIIVSYVIVSGMSRDK